MLMHVNRKDVNVSISYLGMSMSLLILLWGATNFILVY